MAQEDDRVLSPYVGGGLSGVLLVLSVWIVGKYFGASTTFARAASMVEHAVDAERAASLGYFARYAPEIDWQWMFLVGILLGSTVAATTSKSFRWMAVPRMWRERFGPNPIPRAVVAFVGGFIAVFGARLAGGCPSGHGLSGLAQLAVSGYLSLICFFAGGLVVAWALYRGRTEP